MKHGEEKEEEEEEEEEGGHIVNPSAFLYPLYSLQYVPLFVCYFSV